MSLSSVNYGFWDAWLDPIKVTFDGTNKLILINYGETVIDVQRDIYSAWKRWVEQIDNLKWDLALTVVGGDPIDQTNVITPYYFLMNGWRIRPYEGSHNLTITGIILTSDNQDPLVPTLASWNISVTRIVPIKAESILTGGGVAPTSEQNAAAVWNSLLATYASNTAAGKLNSLENTVLPLTYPLSNQDKVDISSEVWNHILEGSLTAMQVQRIVLAALSGKSSTDANTVYFTGADGLTTRITAVVDPEGNRTSVVLNPN